MSIQTKRFGVTKDGKEVTSYILSNGNGMEAEFIDYGACLVKLMVSDKAGAKRDVVLGYDTMEGYENNDTFYGAFVGRNGNRIGGGAFELNGREYKLVQNDGENNLHSGPEGFERKMYEVETFEEDGEATIEFSRLSEDMEQGFPGNLDVTVTYTITSDNALVIEYFGVCDQDTLVNLTNHSYFNLSGHNSGNIEGHKLRLMAGRFAVTDKGLIPTGEMRPVDGTPMDFREFKPIGQDIEADYEPLKFAGGYDHHFVFDKEDGVCLAAEAVDEASGIHMEMYTDLPGVQFYSGNFIDGTKTGKDGFVYEKRAGFCLETQFVPDSVHLKGEKNCILKHGDEFDSTTVYKFSCI